MLRAALCLLLATLGFGPALAFDLDGARGLVTAGRHAEAMEVLLPMAASGSAAAEEMVGMLHATGRGVPQDDRRAFDWFLRAALRGLASSQSAVARAYAEGRGVAADPVRAVAWYGLAALGADPGAGVAHDQLAARLPAADRDAAQAMVEDLAPLLYPYR